MMKAKVRPITTADAENWLDDSTFETKDGKVYQLQPDMKIVEVKTKPENRK